MAWYFPAEPADVGAKNNTKHKKDVSSIEPTSFLSLIIAFIDNNAFGAVFSGDLTGLPFVINVLTTLMMSVCTIATIFSGWDYIKNGKDLLKDM